ncbi:hypothetical protein HDU97_006467 [Phlyctochytrium planicorne]|nr:hypothetical protein HDU97_006467 [Phlyctochytrium planicorne]
MQSDPFVNDDRIKLNHNEHQGRFLTAKRDLSEGEAILENLRPFAFGLRDSFKKRFCAQCLLESEERVFHHRCIGCDQVYFCSKPCMDAAINGGHTIVCGSLRKLATFKASAHEKSIIKLLMLAALERMRQEDQSGQVKTSVLGAGWGGWNVVRAKVGIREDFEEAVKPYVDSLAEELKGLSITQTVEEDADANPEQNEGETLSRPSPYDLACEELFSSLNFESLPNPVACPPLSTEWNTVVALQSHYLEWPLESSKEWKKLRLMTANCLKESKLSQCLKGLEEQSNESLDGLEAAIMHFVSRVESNGFGIWAVPKRGQGDSGNSRACVGRAIYPIASFFNHSCAPTCECIQTQGVVTFKTIRPVLEGEELTISYIDTDIPLVTRRGQLQSEYFFECMCTRCVREAEKPAQRALKGLKNKRK